jgi:hypothetical protein
MDDKCWGFTAFVLLRFEAMPKLVVVVCDDQASAPVPTERFVSGRAQGSPQL